MARATLARARSQAARAQRERRRIACACGAPSTRRDGVRVRSRRPLAGRTSAATTTSACRSISTWSARCRTRAAREGAGGGASHLVCGHHAAHDALERELADWLGYPRALLFGSGYLANLAVLQALLGDERRLRAGPAQPRQPDRRRAPGRLPAAALSARRCRRRAAPAAQRSRDGAAMLATDGVFSMDGDVAPLRELALVARMQQATAVRRRCARRRRARPGRPRQRRRRAAWASAEVPLQLVDARQGAGRLRRGGGRRRRR